MLLESECRSLEPHLVLESPGPSARARRVRENDMTVMTSWDLFEDLEITFQDGLLTIQGERHTAHDPAAEKVHRAERRYGAFRRSITLPSHVMADAIDASAQDGVLQVLVPKAHEVHAKRIQVHP